MAIRRKLLFSSLALFSLLVSSAPGATFSRIANTDTMPPGSGTLFTHFDEPAYRDGKTVFRAVREARYPALYAHTASDGLAIVADFYTPAPGGGVLTDFGPAPDTSSAAVVFSASGSRSLLSDIPFQGVYLSEAGTLTKIADTSTAVPGETYNFSSFGTGPRIRDGRVAFVGRGGGRAALYLWSGGALQRIVDSTITMPGHTEKFWNFDDIDQDGEDVVFRVRSGSNFGGIYRWSAGAVTRLMDQSQVRPDGLGLFGLPWARFAAKDGTLVFLCDAGAFLKKGEQFSRALDLSMSAPVAHERFVTVYTPVETDGATGVLFAGTSAEIGIFLANGGSVWRVRNNATPLDGRQIYNLFWSAQSFHDATMALKVEFLDGSQGLYLGSDLRVPAGSWLNPAQAVRTGGSDGYQALRYNYDTAALSTTEYIPAPAPFGVEMPRGQWTGHYFYDYTAGAFTQAAYSYAHQLP